MGQCPRGTLGHRGTVPPAGAMPPPPSSTWARSTVGRWQPQQRDSPGAGPRTCELEAQGAVGSAVLVAHLAGQQPPGPPAHTQQPQAVLVIVRHHHLTRALQLPQHLGTPAGTAAVTSQLPRQAHGPRDRSRSVPCPTSSR